MVLGHAPHTGAKVRVLGQSGQLHPCLDLLGLGIVGQLWGQRAHDPHEFVVGVQAAEGGVEELADQTSTFFLGELGELVHEIHLLRGAPAPGHRRQHRAPQAQRSDLHRECLSVRRGDLGKRDLPVHDLPDREKVQSQVAQRPYEVQACDGVDAVEAVAGRASAGRRHDSKVRVEPDGLDRQPGPPGQITDRVERAAVHAPTLAPPLRGDSSPFTLAA